MKKIIIFGLIIAMGIASAGCGTSKHKLQAQNQEESTANAKITEDKTLQTAEDLTQNHKEETETMNMLPEESTAPQQDDKNINNEPDPGSGENISDEVVTENTNTSPRVREGEMTELSAYLMNEYNHDQSTNKVMDSQMLHGAFYAQEAIDKSIYLCNEWYFGNISDDELRNSLENLDVYSGTPAIGYEFLVRVNIHKFVYNGYLEADFDTIEATLGNDLMALSIDGCNDLSFGRAYYDHNNDTTNIYFVNAVRWARSEPNQKQNN